MFRNIDQRNNLALLLARVLLLLFNRKSIRTYLRRWWELTYLLTMLPWIHSVNKWKMLIGGVEFLDNSNLAKKLLTVNELIFAEYCEIHACWKREMKSGYPRWYRVNRSQLFLPTRSQIGPEFWPGNVALSWLMLVIVQDIWTFVKVVLVSWLSDAGSTRLVKSSNCLWC